MPWQPTQHYRRAFKKGTSGWDVWALQVALNSHRSAQVSEDGIFGKGTLDAVRQEQQRHHLEVDGIAGVLTQRAVCLAEAKRAEEANGLPKNLEKGLIEGESGYCIAATSAPYPNSTHDVGPLQVNLVIGASDKAIHDAFDLRSQCSKTAAKFRSKHDGYYGMSGAKTDRRAWELAVLSHNWPAAADKLASGQAESWVYTADGRQYGWNDAAAWVQRIGVEGVNTGAQWAAHYIATKCLYVDW